MMRRCLTLCTGDVIDEVRAACCLCEAVRVISQLHFDRDDVGTGHILPYAVLCILIEPLPQPGVCAELSSGFASCASGRGTVLVPGDVVRRRIFQLLS